MKNSSEQQYPVHVAAPGRVNVIGEHTDYNRGFALPLALPHRVQVQARPRTDSLITAESAGHERVEFPLSTRPGAVSGWGAYVAGVVWALAEAGFPVPAADLQLESDVPTGAGLSSSAAVECAVLVALAELADWSIDPTRAALIAQRAENEYVGAPTGSMDQMASMHGQEGHVMFIDFVDDSVTQVPADLEGAGMELLVIDTNAPHQHADGEYGARRRSCERACEVLDIQSLREIALEQLPTALETLRSAGTGTGSGSSSGAESGAVLAKRVRHVVTENARVLDAVQNLKRGDLAALGPILTAGHASLRDDYEVTIPQLDVAVAAALEGGALGARMTGGGFGGSVIALVKTADSPAVEQKVRAAFAAHAFAAPAVFHATPQRGAGKLEAHGVS